MSSWMKLLSAGLVLVFGISACAQSTEQKPNTSENFQKKPKEEEIEIITLLPRDGIPAIDNPEFLSAEEADSEYESSELIIGVNYDGDARAYSIPFLSRHEIVNDTVGGRKIAVTW